jgi:hypothetical protein
VNLSAVDTWFSWRRAFAPALVGAAIVAVGCDSSSGGNNPPPPGSDGVIAKKVNPDDLYKYVGEGAAKRKEAVSRRERVKLLREAAKKPD